LDARPGTGAQELRRNEDQQRHSARREFRPELAEQWFPERVDDCQGHQAQD
jgi:hypothetical protein